MQHASTTGEVFVAHSDLLKEVAEEFELLGREGHSRSPGTFEKVLQLLRVPVEVVFSHIYILFPFFYR